MSFQDLYRDASARERAAGYQAQGSRNRYADAITRVSQFDPQQYLNQSAQAAFGSIREGFATDESRRGANLNRRGLLGSNLGGAAAERGFQERLAQAMAGLSMQAGQMQMGVNQQAMSGYGDMYGRDTDQQNRFYDAAYGAHASDIQQKAAEKASKRSMWGQIAGAGLGLAGTLLSGPIGGAVAGKIGSKIFGGGGGGYVPGQGVNQLYQNSFARAATGGTGGSAVSAPSWRRPDYESYK